MEMVRINKYLADMGVCSRRGADKLVEEGRVLVNGKRAVVGQTISSEDEVIVDKKIISNAGLSPATKVVLAFNKPVGVTVSEKDAHAEKLITDMIDYPIRVTYAGRLDKDSEGLILLTNDGDFINALMKAANNHEKEYLVSLNKEISDRDIDRLSKGIFIKDLNRKTKPCEIKRIGKYSVSMILTEGLNRQIRRMWKIVGYEVTKLKRIRIENILLNDLRPGKWREIQGLELEELYKSVGMQVK